MWKIILNLNTDNPKLGTVTALWTVEESGEQFAYTDQRVNTDTLVSFKASAIAARDKWLAARTAQSAREAELAAFMNS